MRNRIPTHLAALALAVALMACGSGRGSRYQDPGMDFGSVRTVAVLPFANYSRDNLAAERVRDVFATSLLASGAIYVIPSGEVIRSVGKAGVASAVAPSVEEVVKLGQLLKADAVITGAVKEYGEVRSGTSSANVVSLTVQIQETSTGKVVWSGSTTQGGIGFKDRLLGGGGQPLNDVTEAAVDDLLNKLFR